MSNSPCQRPGCTGTYAPDGYCDECGHKAAPGATQASTSTQPSTGGQHGTSRSRSSRSGGRGRLGASLVAVPPVPLRDPTTAVMADPQVPESHRVCGHCGRPVGRSRDGRPGRAEGFCPEDGTPFSFRPRLAPGDLVDKRYEILGALAHGGLGWIYLARDRNISESGADRWVVLKGLINTGDVDAMAAAMAERRFLVEVDHPNIVKIHDFAQHPDPKTGEMVGYIVMEYVGGRSLKDLALAHSGPLPLTQVLAYGIEVLPALGYLHDRGLLFCDFKPDNVIHAEEQLKLIDLGAVRRADDHDSALWGTPGYQAPELARQGASVASDLYTVGRSMAVLSFDFTGFSTRYAERLPEPGDVPLLAREESYYRFLRRAAHPDPALRFASAGEMQEQALGVLREVLSMADGTPRPAASAQFTPERRAFGGELAGPPSGAAGREALDGPTVAAALPLPLADPADPAAGFLATVAGSDAVTVAAYLRGAPVRTAEVSLRLIRALVEAGDLAGAGEELASLDLPAGDWRREWSAGLIALASGDPERARAAFDAVYGALPGEPAAQLALAAAAELAGDRDGASLRYRRVWRVDHAFVSAAFGLARTLLATGERDAAVGILDEVPDSSSQHVAAQIAAVRARLSGEPAALSEVDLVDASARLSRLRLDEQRRANLAIEMFRSALAWLGAKAPAVAIPQQRAVSTVAGGGKVLGQELREREVRFGLERAYRLLATLEPDPRARYALVDEANSVRPRTLV
jgi:serine/threonine-protein kinase PknG